MTTALVSISRHEASWLKPQETLLIGKDILELLSSSMYVDPMTMYREYIQNAADAIDIAKATGVLNGGGCVHVTIDRNSRTVRIRDNGVGLDKQNFVQRLTAFGGSKKRGTRARGFRGVGRLAGLAYCKELSFRSRALGESSVHELRWDSREIRSALRKLEPEDLFQLVGRSIETREILGNGWPEHFFEVELREVARHGSDRLLEESEVGGYLSQVAPVPFHPDFALGKCITEFLRSHDIDSDLNITIEGIGRIYRPHRNSLRMTKVAEVQFHDLETLTVPGRDGGVAAATWILHHDYMGAIPPTNLAAGWRVRSGDVQVGSNNLLEGLFPETRFNGWTVGETHVLDSRIIPNGRRDHFEQNAHFLDLLNHLTPLAREIAQRCRMSSARRNLTKYLETRCSEIEQGLRLLREPLLAEEYRLRLASDLENAIALAERSVRRPMVDAEIDARFAKRIDAVRRSASRLVGRKAMTRPAAMSPAQRRMLDHVCTAIYATTSDAQLTRKLLSAVMAQIRNGTSRQRRSTVAGNQNSGKAETKINKKRKSK